MIKNEVIDLELLEILACPLCKSDLRLEDQRLICLNKRCIAKEYYIEEGIPIMIPLSQETEEDLKLTIKKWDLKYTNQAKDLNLNLNEPVLIISNNYIKNFWGNTGGLFLEVGCGWAKDSLLLAKEGVNVVGIDISLEAVKNAKTLFKSEGIKGQFVCGDILNMPFKSNQFSFMYAGGTIEHFENTGKALNELYFCLKKNGKLFATVPYISLSMLTYGQLQGNIPELPIIKQIMKFIHITLFRNRFMINGYEKSFTQRKIRTLFEKAFFSNIQTGFFDTYYEIRRFDCLIIKKILRRLVRNKLFWPLIYICGDK